MIYLYDYHNLLLCSCIFLLYTFTLHITYFSRMNQLEEEQELGQHQYESASINETMPISTVLKILVCWIVISYMVIIALCSTLILLSYLFTILNNSTFSNNTSISV